LSLPRHSVCRRKGDPQVLDKSDRQSGIIVPYRVVHGKTELLPPKQLQRDWPLTFAYLNEAKSHLQGREDGKMSGNDWYAFSRNQALDVISLPKLLTPDIANRSSFAWDSEGAFAFTSGYAITLKHDCEVAPLYVLGLLNSSLIETYWKQVSTPIRGGFYRFFSQFLAQLPIRTIDFANPADKKAYDEMVRLVDQMLTLHCQLAASGTDREKSALQLQIAALDRAIDSLVFRLYNLDASDLTALADIPR